MKETLAILGGTPAIDPKTVPGELFRWPIFTREEEEAALDVIRRNAFSGTDITRQFEQEVCQ